MNFVNYYIYLKIKLMDSTNVKKCSATNGKNVKSKITQGVSFFLTLFLFFGCVKDELANVKADAFDGKITAKVENGATYNSQISTVWALYNAEISSSGGLTGQILVNCAYSDGGFTINLSPIPASFLKDVQTFFTTVLHVSGDLEYSNPDARLLNVDFFGISSNNLYVDYFTYTKTGSKRTTCVFVYADSEVTVKGGTNIKVILKQGWNRIYWSSSDNKVTSSAPSGIKWYLSKDAQ